LKRSFNTSGIFVAEPSLLFYRFEKHKRRIFEKSARHSIGVARWQAERCASDLAVKEKFLCRKSCEKAKKSMGIIEKHTLVKLLPFEL
jgi:hypothetical protein